MRLPLETPIIGGHHSKERCNSNNLLVDDDFPIDPFPTERLP